MDQVLASSLPKRGAGKPTVPCLGKTLLVFRVALSYHLASHVHFQIYTHEHVVEIEHALQIRPERAS